MRILSLLLFCSCCISFSQGQTRCGTEQYMMEQLRLDPSLAQRLQQASVTPSKKGTGEGTVDPSLIIIPIVVHILYNTPEQNISAAQVQSQIDVLNKDFGKRNADINKVPTAFSSLAADTRIQFALATVDPEGRATNGIVRKQTARTTWKQDDQMKFNASQGDNAWNREDYLNIWVCNLERSLLGYSSFPGGTAEKDGVVIRTDVFGGININHPVYNKGRTTTHEVGHWLNLKHLWGNSDCGDDEVEDTPQQKTYNTGCSSFPKINSGSCSVTSAHGDMFMNFMDFSDDACIVMFTNGQGERMRSLFANGNARAAITRSKALGTPWNSSPAVDENPDNLTILLAPNPATQTISLFSQTQQAFNAEQIILSDYTGKRLLQINNRSTIDVNQLKPGLYLLQIKNNGHTTVKKFVKK